MEKKNKGLADNYDADFILNESGTSVKNPELSEDKQANSNPIGENQPTSIPDNEVNKPE